MLAPLSHLDILILTRIFQETTQSWISKPIIFHISRVFRVDRDAQVVERIICQQRILPLGDMASFAFSLSYEQGEALALFLGHFHFINAGRIPF